MKNEQDLERKLTEMDMPEPPKGFEDAVAARIAVLGSSAAKPEAGQPRWRDRLGWALTGLGAFGAAALALFSGKGYGIPQGWSVDNPASFLFSGRLAVTLDPMSWTIDAAGLGLAGAVCVVGLMLLSSSPKQA